MGNVCLVLGHRPRGIVGGLCDVMKFPFVLGCDEIHKSWRDCNIIYTFVSSGILLTAKGWSDFVKCHWSTLGSSCSLYSRTMNAPY